MNWALASLLLVSSAAAVPTEIPRLSINRLKTDRDSRTDLHALLANHGLLRVAAGDSAAKTRRAALAGMCKCSAFNDQDVLDSHPQDMEAKVLNDNTDRRTVGTASFGLSRTLDLPPWLEEECGKDTFDSFEALRDVVSNVVDLFVSKLDQENGESPAALTSEKTYREAMSTVNHLEHFHVYDKPSSAADGLETLKFHTDAGFFLVFVPAMDCRSSGTDNESFFLKGSDVPLTFEDDEVIIMMGAGSQYSLSSDRTSGTFNRESPFVAAPHALRMKAGIRRSWYGKMHLLPAPDVEHIQLSFDEPMQLMPQDVHRKLSAIPTDCNNVTSFFCWRHCIDFPDKPVDGAADQSMYCADPAKVTEEGNITEAYEACGGGFAHNGNCKGIWTETVDDPAITPYDFITGSVTIGVEIKFDAYPEDISWTLTNTCHDREVIGTGGGYTRTLYNQTLTTNFATPNGIFELHIEDAHGDGLCCEYGDGFYSVLSQRKELYSSKFENPSTREIVPFGSSDNCPAKKVQIRIDITFDSYPDDISWELMNICNGATKSLGKGRKFGTDDRDKTVTVYDASVSNGQFKFVITDSYGDGMENGGYTIFYGDKEITSGFSSAKETEFFGVSDKCEPPKPKCNGNGLFFESEAQVLDVLGREVECECFACFSGDECEIKSPITDCFVGAGSVELGLVKEIIPFTTVTATSEFRTDYQSWKSIAAANVTSDNPSKQLDYALYTTLAELHAKAGNVVTEGYTLVVGLGAHQLVQAANIALHKVEQAANPGTTFESTVYGQAPYWSKFPRMINFFDGMLKWGDRTSASRTDAGRLIEIMTSPSNPANLLASEQEPLLARKDRQIWDLVYYWPSCYAADIEMIEEDVMIFSLSKLAGFSGHRFAWAWVKDKEVADEMADFVSVTTQAYPASQFLYSIRMLQQITASIGTKKDFFVEVQAELMTRCREMEAVLATRSRTFTNLTPCGNMYILVECESDCAPIFADIGLEITDGPSMGAPANTARLAFGFERAWFDTVVEKLALL